VVVVVVVRLPLAKVVMENPAQCGLFGPALHDHSHRLIQETCNESLYSN
jgi:hypothetical protein